MKRGDSKVIARVVLRKCLLRKLDRWSKTKYQKSQYNTLPGIVPTHFPTTELLPCLLFLQLLFPLGVNVTGIFPTCKVEGIHTSLIINHRLDNYLNPCSQALSE